MVESVEVKSEHFESWRHKNSDRFAINLREPTIAIVSEELQLLEVWKDALDAARLQGT